MLAHKYIPSRLISPSERPTIPVSSPRKPSWMRPLRVMIGLLRLVAELLWSRLTKSSNLSQYGRRARIALERLGPLWIKAGQILSLRGDLFSTEACVELAKIQESAEGMSFEWVRGILEQELERPLESVFEQFGKTPFGATPLAQLHRAYLRREQVWMVVKVQTCQLK